MPSASTSEVIVEAVPIELQWPTLGVERRLELVELRLGHPARAQLVGVVPEIGAGAELPAPEPGRLGRARR